MNDFKQWCIENELITISENGIVALKKCEKEPIKSGTLVDNKDDKSNKVRDIRQDLSKDYKDPAKSFGTVWPFKVLAKGNVKPIAKVE